MIKYAFTVWCLLPIIVSLFYILYYFRSKEIIDVITGVSGIAGYIFYQVVIVIASHLNNSIMLVYTLKFFIPFFLLLLIVRVKDQEWYDVKNTVFTLLGFLGMVLFIGCSDLIFK
ncbi:hypothetical protein [Desulfosporosinus youngiae]|uniref:Uncharacterized protein n=1 Tax=Desulfosporosinus youngiae DSM 17734 TaxID=768710 RepID=H5Y561_9FIRM|nr:hypothetical protein [Desulfosporosinus youngiae]EHQ90165.1 hypothetical protein DesyoDRAFT_3131 [Desulfosporosinus youngiae DSM 17734]